MKRQILGLVSAALFIVAMLVTSSASWLMVYQPKTPKALLK